MKKNVLYTYTEEDFPEGEAPYYVVIDLSDISKFTDAMNNIGEPLAYERDEDKAYYLFNTEDEVYIFTSAIEGKYEYEIYGPDESEEFNADIEDPEDYYDEATESIKRNDVPAAAFARLKNTGFSVSEFNKIRETFIEEKRKRRQLELHNNPEAILKNEQFKDLPCVNVLLYGTKDAGKKTMVSALSKALASMGTATIKEVSDLSTS